MAANVALRTGDTTRAARAEVLRKHKVTEDQLRAFVAGHARDTLLAGVWDEIASGVESKRSETEADAAVAPVQQADAAPREAIRKLPRVMQTRTRIRAPVEERDTAASPATPETSQPSR